MPGVAVAYVVDCSALKGLRVRVIKDLNCHVDGKLGNRLCRGLNKSALDLWPNLIQQKIISVHIECCALMETEIKERWK